MTNILTDGRFSRVETITDGWSGDRKYRVTSATGIRHLLRISPIARYENRRVLFDLLKRVTALGVPLCEPVELGTCDDGVYMLLDWIDGEDLRPALPRLPAAQQHALGMTSGEALRTMHTIEAPPMSDTWSSRFNSKIDAKLKGYAECGITFDGDHHVVTYIQQHRGLLDGRPQTFQHGDFHDGNMMLENGDLRIIDFDRYDFGDPWEEFNRIVWSAANSPPFASGQLHGYFGADPPPDFFRLLALYIATNTLSSIPWAAPFGRSEVDVMLHQAGQVLTWYDDMRDPLPRWYIPYPGASAGRS